MEAMEEAAPAQHFRLPFSIFDTNALPEKEAFAVWQEQISTFIDVRQHDRDEPFFGAIQTYFIDGVQLGSLKTASQSWNRSRYRIGRDGFDHYALQFYFNGICGRRDSASGSHAREGDLFICDLAQPHHNETIDPQALYLMVPRAKLAPLLKAADTHSCRVISGRDPLVALLREHLLALFRQAPRMSVDEAAAAIGPTLHLAAAAIEAGPTEEHAGAVNLALAQQIRRFIDHRLMDAKLSAEAVAAHFGISTRKLYYLMESSGGFASYVQEARLRRVRADLVDPRQGHRSIAEIAQGYGFTHRKSFIRAFRRLYEVGPREMRQLRSQATALPPKWSDGHDWRRWMHEAG